MDQAPEDPHVAINIVQRQHGAEFDQTSLHLPVGAFTIWINQTDTTQVILPLTQGVRRVMTLASKEQEGRVWMMRSSHVGTFQWQLQSNPTALITVTLTDEKGDKGGQV